MFTVHLSKTSNKKLGKGVYASTTSADSCPVTCGMYAKCYAKKGPQSWHWAKVNRAERGTDWNTFCSQVEKLKPGTLFRHNVSGDLPYVVHYHGETWRQIDTAKLDQLQCATVNAGVTFYTYTHTHTDSTTKGQAVFLAERASELMQENIITDRTIIDVMAFAKASKSMNYYDAEKFCEFAKTMLHEYDYLFYVSPEGVSMEDNGVRETDLQYRETIDSIIKFQLDFNKHRIKNLIHIKGSTEERIAQVRLFLYHLET